MRKERERENRRGEERGGNRRERGKEGRRGEEKKERIE